MLYLCFPGFLGIRKRPVHSRDLLVSLHLCGCQSQEEKPKESTTQQLGRRADNVFFKKENSEQGHHDIKEESKKRVRHRAENKGPLLPKKTTRRKTAAEAAELSRGPRGGELSGAPAPQSTKQSRSPTLSCRLAVLRESPRALAAQKTSHLEDTGSDSGTPLSTRAPAPLASFPTRKPPAPEPKHSEPLVRSAASPPTTLGAPSAPYLPALTPAAEPRGAVHG